MNPLNGPLTADQRDSLALTADRLAPLPHKACRDLAERLTCIAHTRLPSPALLHETCLLANTAHRALLSDACPDRWLDELTGFDPTQQSEIVADLIAEREGQAEQVAAATTLLQSLLNRTARV